MTRTQGSNQRRADGVRRAWEERRLGRPPAVTDGGFAPHAVILDAATGCCLWQNNMNGSEPRAAYRRVMINPRHLAYERAGHTIPDGYRLVPTCGQQRCITPDHQEARPRRRPPAPPKPRPVPETPLRKAFAGRLPAERPPQVREQDWRALTAVVSGKKLAEVAIELGVSRQRVHQIVERARLALARARGEITPSAPGARDRVGADAHLLTTKQVAGRLGVTPHRVSALARSRGVGQMLWRARLFSEADVAAMQDRHPGRPRTRATPAAS